MRRPARRLGRSALAVAALAAIVASCGPASTPLPSLSPSPAPTPVPSPTSTSLPPPAGTVLVDVPEAGARVPVPAGWVTYDAAALADPAVRGEIAAYPGAAELLAATEALGDRAAVAFLAVDPAGTDAPLASNLSVLVAQPSVGGPLLDLVAGFIADAVADVLGAAGPPDRERVDLPIGEAVRLGYDVPDGSDRIVATSHVIGAPAGTLMVTLMGTASALDGRDADALAGAIAPLSGSPAP